MSPHSPFEIPSDLTLVAFLDGELSAADAARIEALREREPVIAERLALLEQGCAGLPEGFAPLLDAAPTAYMQAMLGALPAPEAVRPPSSQWSRRRLLAGAAACLVAGVLGDRVWRGWQASRWVDDGNWRGSVAQYMALYTAQTLDGLEEGSPRQTEQLARVGEQLGVALTPERVGMEGASLRRAQVLRYDNDLIAQLVYLDDRQQPLALCFVKSSQPASPPAQEVRHGLNVVHWSDGRHAWMLAGRSPMTELQVRQQQLALS
ncbi:anti-sigma factor family protein [Pseudomonas syringae group genomosp. 3]|uniref:Transmembrane anti-sigma factor n=1 Tax=Pseudomonas syringae pv. viburni TaxID=251703 RepID=A0A0Q0GD96_9PSED|nr:hypothetical protein [Pseudomonas syringae group genomosp. 3]KPZ11322.1 Transmembrane anti-sigma factor [Pseudomonas syringae pv. viburni]